VTVVTVKIARLLLAAVLLAGAGAAGADERVTYSYDALGRLVASSNSGTANNGLTTQIGYDPAGNRSSYNVSGAGGAPANPTVPGAPVVSDGSFELPEVGSGYVYGPAAAGTAFAGGAGVAGNGSAWGFQAAPDGDQVGFLQGAGGSITLTVTGLTPGASYRVGFSLAQRAGYGAVTVAAAFGQTGLGSYTPASVAFASYATTNFTAAGTSGQIVFSVPAAQGDVSAAIDNVTVALAASPPAAPVVADGSFELPEVGGGFVYAPAPAGTAFAGGAGVAGNGSAFGFQAAPDGDQTGFLQAASSGGGSITLNVTGLTPGATYRVGFSLAQRPGFGAVTVAAAFGQTALGSYTPTSAAFTPFTTTTFTPAGTSGRIVFSAGAAPGDVATAIDQVMLELVG